jgi:predicted transposase YdaD
VRRPDVAESGFPLLMQRHPNFTQELRHSRAAQELIEEGRQEEEARGEARGEVKATLRQLSRLRWAAR